MDVDAPMCYCGLRSPLRTSMTTANPGRRFYGCARYDGQNVSVDNIFVQMSQSLLAPY